jgi:hypothetical protein
MLRKLIKQLFITYKEGCHRAASHDAISKWIVRTISICYRGSKESDFCLARAHDTRSLSTLESKAIKRRRERLNKSNPKINIHIHLLLMINLLRKVPF